MAEQQINNADDELTMNLSLFMKKLTATITKRLDPQCQPCTQDSAKLQSAISTVRRCKVYTRNAIAHQRILFRAFTIVLICSITCCAIASEERFKENSESVPIGGGRKPDEFPEYGHGGANFNSRKDISTDGRLPDDLYYEQDPTVPEPNLPEELNDDWTKSEYNESDSMQLKLSMESFNRFWTQLYIGPVCTLVDVRNGPRDLKDLENCTIVDGFVQITFMHDTDESIFEGYSFPKLRVITEYLLIYRVYGLRSLKKLFPNLAVIGGRQVFYNYALILFENPRLREIGLGNLRRIERGKVRIQKNSQLCHIDTIDWERLGVEETVIADNALTDGGHCDNQCSLNGSCVDHVGTITEHCWGRDVCQQKKCPSECPNACEDGVCICHEECLGGCTQPNNASACLACLHKNYYGECVKECPDDTYLEKEWRCITRDACLAMTWVPHEMYYEKEGKVMKKCLYLCPPNHVDAFRDEPPYEAYCKNCNTTCNKVCDEKEVYTVTDVSTAEELNGCTHIPGGLAINHLVGDDVMEVLESSLRGLEEVGSLSIRRAESLFSLGFLKSLKRITGKNLIDKRYSLYITNNPNLYQLFPNANSTGPEKLQIDKGMAFFHYNPKLCMKEIDLVSALTVGEEDDNDIGTMTNGDRATCDMRPLIITSIEHRPMDNNDLASVRIKWEKVYVDDKRTLIGYQIFYKESKNQDAKRYEGRNVCTQTGSGWNIKDALFGPQKSSKNDSDVMEYITAFIHNLKPYTQYALYIMTYTTSSNHKGAQSNITYFTTNPSKPSEPAHLTAHAINSSAIKVQWKPPVNPNGVMAYYVVKWRKQDYDEERISLMDTCNQGRTSLTVTNPTLSPTTTSAPEVDKTKECCSCKNTPDHMSLENEAKDNIEFENHLQRKIFAPLPLPFPSLVRKRRAIDLSQPYNESRNVSSDESYYDDSDYHFMTNIGEGSYESYRNDYTGITYEGIVVKDEEVIISNLSHYTKYEIQVYACNHAATEDGSKCSYDALVPARTDYRLDVDDIPEESLKVTEREKKDGEMQPALQWDPPVNPNGYVESYHIDIQEDNKYGPSYESDQLYCYTVRKFNKNQRTFVIPFALAAGPHRARVRAVTLAGKGNWTKFVTFDIPQSAAEKARARRQNLEIGIVVGTVFLVIVAIIAIFGYKVKKKRDARKIVIYSSTNPEYISLAANYIPDGYEVDLKDIELTKVIGHGNFGKVYMGFARNVIKGEERTKVAIKKLHEKSGIHKRYEFLEEAKLMKGVSATHVVRLLGVVSQTTDPMVIMEYMAQGDLKTYLRSRRADIEIHGEEKCTPPSLQERLQMAAEIADGMAYLADIKFIHRDLAARNCLVSSEGVVKISDFGLARDVYETDYYRKDSKGLLPIRWMAPESLRDGVFDVCSDVWSYGVVLWEIATLAEQPYQGRQHDEVTRYVIDGGYMEKPKKCPKKLYDLMLSCWQFHPEMRPKFEEILSSLANDVTERFKEESYFFEHKRMKFDRMLKFHERATEEDLYLKCDEHFFKDDACRMVTPLNVTPARSRCETPSGYQTPASRYSNGSVKVGCEMLAHCDHLKRVDVLDLKAVTPCAQIPGSKHIVRANNINRKRSKGGKKSESVTKRFSGNPTTRTDSKSSSKFRKKSEGFSHSVSTGSLGSEYPSDSSDSENAVTSQMLPAADNYSNQCDETVDHSIHERHDALTLPRARINAESYSDTEKPYALMNGFVNRLDSLGRHGSPFRRSNKRTKSTSDESSYVESSPLNSAHYFDTNDFISSVVEVEAAPPPPSSPPPLPPVGHAS